MTSARSTHFIAVDLELEGGDDLPRLVAALQPALLTLPPEDSGQSVVCLELQAASDDLHADLRRVIDALLALPPEVRPILAGCTRKIVNIGTQAGVRSRSYEFAVSPDLLASLVAVGVSLAVRIYAHEP